MRRMGTVAQMSLQGGSVLVHNGALGGETHPHDDYVVHVVRAGEVVTIGMVCDRARCSTRTCSCSTRLGTCWRRMTTPS